MLTKSKLEILKNNRTLLEVAWKDITTKDRIKRLNSKLSKPTDFLIVFKTFGFVYEYDDYSVALCREEEDDMDNSSEIDLEIIPIACITSYTEYTKKGGEKKNG